MKTIPVLLFVTLLPAVASAAAVYKYVDKDGRVHYTDIPPEDVAKTEVQIERPDAPIGRRDDWWRSAERDMNQRLAFSKNRQADCEDWSAQLRQMRSTLNKDRRTQIYVGGQRITPGRLDFMEQNWKEFCSS
jgi:hypothetical protein